MIGIVLCAGKGSRIPKLNYPNKCLLRFQEVSLLQKTLSHVNELDEISKVIIVVNYNKDEVIAEAKRSTHKELVIIEQQNLNGIIGAIEQCIPIIGDDDFMLMLGDEYYEIPKYKDFLSCFISSELRILAGVVYVDDNSRINKTYGVTVKNGKLIHFEEKPKNSVNNIMGTGTILFRNSTLKYINKIEVNKQRNERDLVDLLNLSIKDNEQVHIYEISKHYYNINDNHEIEDLNTFLEYRKKGKEESKNG